MPSAMSAPIAHRPSTVVPLDAVRDHPARIDVRSPSEYADDHIPGADSHPVLDDAQRVRIGTLYAQHSAFVARREGAALVARNIAAMIEGPFAEKPRDWAPLVYCWRGGQRSRSLVHVLTEIGFRAVQLDGGYRAWRRHVVMLLAHLPQQFRFRVVCGLTGSGKSRLIEALAAEGGQVLDLERLAKHRGSLLGDLPGDPQPTQKSFESALFATLTAFDARRPVFVESESQRIGRLQVPEELLAAMRASPCIRLDTPQALRVAMLEADYAHFAGDEDRFHACLRPLAKLHGKAAVERWGSLARNGATTALTADLLDVHYDPSYERAIRRNFPRYREALMLTVDDASPAAFARLARQLLEGSDATAVAASST
jgi:tRNA 2-selenouridine synthase